LPIGGVGAGGAARGVGKIIKSTKTFLSRVGGNPFAGRTVAQVGRSIAGRGVAGLGAGTGAVFISSAITGQPLDASQVRRILLGSAGFAVGGIPGLIAGGLGAGISTTALLASRGAELLPPPPQIPEPFDIGEALGGFTSSTVINLGEFGAGFSGGVAAPPGAIIAPSFAPQIRTGGNDLLPLLLLLLAGGTGGFLLGRRRKSRKKKKTKKKKKKRK